MLARLLTGLPSGFLRNLKWQYIANLGAGALGGLYMLLLGRLLGVSEFGVYALSISFATLIFNLFDMRLQEATIRFIGHAEGEDPSEATVNIKVLTLLDIGTKLAAFVIFISALPLAETYLLKGHDAKFPLFLAGLSMLFAKAGNSPAIGVLRLTEKFDLHARIMLLDWGAKLLLTALLSVFVPLTVELSLITFFVVGMASNLLTLLVARHNWVSKYGNHNTSISGRIFEKFREFRHFVLSSQGISIFDNIVKEMDTSIIGWFLTIEAVGIYRMAKQITQLLWRVADPVFLVIMPEFKKFLDREKADHLQAFLKRITGILLASAVALYLCSVVCVPWLVKMFLGAEFSQTAAIFPIMALWIVVCLPLIWTHALAAAAGRPDVQLRANIIGNIVAAVLLIAGTKFFGLYGAAIGWATGLSATFVISFLFVLRSRLHEKQ